MIYMGLTLSEYGNGRDEPWAESMSEDPLPHATLVSGTSAGVRQLTEVGIASRKASDW